MPFVFYYLKGTISSPHIMCVSILYIKFSMETHTSVIYLPAPRLSMHETREGLLGR